MARILVIDDDEAMRAGIRRFLTGEGHEVVVAENGKDALRLFEAEPADLVITDINMPEMDGIEIITTFQKVSPGVPVIAISGGGLFPKELLLDNADLLGAVESLEKPFELEDLRGAVERGLASAG